MHQVVTGSELADLDPRVLPPSNRRVHGTEAGRCEEDMAGGEECLAAVETVDLLRRRQAYQLVRPHAPLNGLGTGQHLGAGCQLLNVDQTVGGQNLGPGHEARPAPAGWLMQLPDEGVLRVVDAHAFVHVRLIGIRGNPVHEILAVDGGSVNVIRISAVILVDVCDLGFRASDPVDPEACRPRVVDLALPNIPQPVADGLVLFDVHVVKDGMVHDFTGDGGD